MRSRRGLPSWGPPGCGFSCRLLHCGTSPACATTTSRSGGGRLEIEYVLLGIGLWRGCLEQPPDWSSMHKICLYEPGEGERAFDNSVGIVRQAEQQEGYEGDRDLNADGVLGGPQEVADFQSLLDPSKEQLDGPSTLVQIGNFLCTRGQIVGEDAQHFAGLDHDLNLADKTRHRIFAGGFERFGKVTGPIAQNRRSRRDRPLLDDLERSVGLEARHNAAAGVMEPTPPAITG